MPDLPLVGVNHLEGHIYSAWVYHRCETALEPKFPLLALLVSGGHSELNLITEHLKYRGWARPWMTPPEKLSIKWPG